MNTVSDNAIHHQPNPNPATIAYQDHDLYPLGTFVGTIYKVRYFYNGTLVPSDTSDQLIADRLK
jgi:hypothetical protein